MSEYIAATITSHFRGRFITDPETLKSRHSRIKGYLFDWDGVFNGGQKEADGSSPFNELDSMGINMLRFNHLLRTGSMPVIALITGEKNPAAFRFAEREHLDMVYFSVKDKIKALEHLCEIHPISPEETSFVFDDILDLSVAPLCGLRFMISRPCTPLLQDYAIRKGLADYIPACDGSHYAVREITELLTGLNGLYQETIDHRVQFSDTYREYLEQRNFVQTQFFTQDHSDHSIVHKIIS